MNAFEGAVDAFEAETLINARNSTVWDIITDAGNYPVWDSGITHIQGELLNGGAIRVRTTMSGKRMFFLRVEQIPGEVMTWTARLPLGLFKGVLTFTLTPVGVMTRLRVRGESRGPLRSVVLTALPGMAETLANYVRAVQKRAEIVG